MKRPEPLVLSALATAFALGACTPSQHQAEESEPTAFPMYPHTSPSPEAYVHGGYYVTNAAGHPLFVPTSREDEQRRIQQEKIRANREQVLEEAARARAADAEGEGDSTSSSESESAEGEGFGSHGAGGDAGG